MSEERDSGSIYKWSAREIVQTLFAMVNWQTTISKYGNVDGGEELTQVREAREDLRDRAEKLREQIGLWGGKEAIDKWLENNDPGHTTPSGITMDWNWLEETCQTPEELSSS